MGPATTPPMIAPKMDMMLTPVEMVDDDSEMPSKLCAVHCTDGLVWGATPGTAVHRSGPFPGLGHASQRPAHTACRLCQRTSVFGSGPAKYRWRSRAVGRHSGVLRAKGGGCRACVVELKGRAMQPKAS